MIEATGWTVPQIDAMELHEFRAVIGYFHRVPSLPAVARALAGWRPEPEPSAPERTNHTPEEVAAVEAHLRNMVAQFGGARLR